MCSIVSIIVLWGQDHYHKYISYGWYKNKSATHPSFPRATHIFIQEYDGYFSPSGYKHSLISHNCFTLSATCMPETFLHVHPQKLYLEKYHHVVCMVIRLSQCRRWCFCVGLCCTVLSLSSYITMVQSGARGVPYSFGILDREG